MKYWFGRFLILYKRLETDLTNYYFVSFVQKKISEMLCKIFLSCIVFELFVLALSQTTTLSPVIDEKPIKSGPKPSLNLTQSNNMTVIGGGINAEKGKPSSAYGCHKGYCWSECYIPLFSTGAEWCYTTATGVSQDYNYVRCSQVNQCQSFWSCAGPCSA